MIKIFVWFIKKYYLNIFIYWITLSVILSFYAGNNLKFNLVIIPLISFFFVVLFHLELERPNIQNILVIEILTGMVLGLLFPLFRKDLSTINGILAGFIIGLCTPAWVKIFIFIRKKIGKYI